MDKTPSGSRTEPCSLLRRLGAMTYDALIVIGILLLAAAIASPLDDGNQQALRNPVYTAYLLAAWFLYLAYCWRYLGMTVGMRAWQVRIRTDTGEQVSWKAGLIRFAGSLLSAGCAGLGFLWSLFDADRRCWHDRLSRTGLYRVRNKKSRSP